MDIKILQDTPPWDWPANAGKIFQKLLANRTADASDRLVAADLAGDLVVMNDELADSLLAIVSNSDEPETLRATAAISLGPILEYADTDMVDSPEDVPISERTFHNIQASLKKLYFDKTTPKEVRRRILEAAVRASEDWNQNAIAAAYASGDREWILTAVFCMGRVRGFDDQILESLKSPDPDIHLEAVRAAGTWEVAGAWSHVIALVEDPATPKPLLLAAIGAVANIRPGEALDSLAELSESDDEEIAEAVDEAMAMATALEEGDEEKDEDEVGPEWIN
jgi:hypothetical protein